MSGVDAIKCIPDSLYMLLKLIIGGDDLFDESENSDVSENKVMKFSTGFSVCCQWWGKVDTKAHWACQYSSSSNLIKRSRTTI